MNQTIEILAEIMRETGFESEILSISPEEIKPYPGLRPFEYKERFLFFGRDGKAQEIAERLEQSHFVAVVGTSGSGKSSLVRAGLLPLLFGGKIYELGSRWRIALMRPGEAPIRNLADALAYPTDFDEQEEANELSSKDETQIGIIEATLRRSGVGLIEFFSNPANNFAADENLLIIVDQFEELFRFKESLSMDDSDEASAFVKLLIEATHDRKMRIYVVITMRSDFLGDCAEFRDLPAVINKGQYLIPRMTRNQLRESIECPARVADAGITPALVNRLLNDYEDDENQSNDFRERMLKDRLPVLQHALMRTWDFWKTQNTPEREINIEHYLKIGGMTNALSNHADEAFNELPTERMKKIAERLFKSLTVTDSENRVTRRPVSLKDLGEIVDAEINEVVWVIDVFRREGRSFLMPPPNVWLDEQSIIDISHESLIRKWTTLKKWVEEEVSDVRIYRRLSEDAFFHYREPSEKDLLTGSEFTKPSEWEKNFKPTKAWAGLYYRIWGLQSLASYEETIKYLENSKNQLDEQMQAREEDSKQRKEIERERKLLEQAEYEREQLRQQAKALSSSEDERAYIESLRKNLEIQALEQESKLRQEIERERKLREQAEAEREQLRQQAKSLALSEDERAEIEIKRKTLEAEAEKLEREIQERRAFLDSIKEQKAEIIKKDAQPPQTRTKVEDSYIAEAIEILRGKNLPPEEILVQAKKLKVVSAFNYAHRILKRAADDASLNQNKKLKLRIYQERALCTYKDSDLPADGRLDQALEILREVEDLETTKNQETLGLVGAIYKRKWEVDNQKQQLERSLLYYTRGYLEGPTNDQGYTAINAAFILDLLAYQEEEEARKANTNSTVARERRIQSRTIREEIIEKVAPLLDKTDMQWLSGEWWFYSTIAEAYFGLNKYEKAVEWLRHGKERVETIPEWEMESAVRQLARLALLQSDSISPGSKLEETPAWRTLQDFFGNPAAVRRAFVGKIGLALSGGGFRAALYHIGTLAKLAELDVLRNVEVLSCVSGGSIIGTHYYLEVRRLLKSKSDSEITKQDYVDIVRRIEKDFLKGVQQNIRVRVAAEFFTNLKMIFFPRYSRTHRVGELFEEEIFSRVKDGENTESRWLNDLNIYPKDEPGNFAPKLHNWRRAAKAPILILNATTLNTGHNWQFTTTWMGEPPSAIDTEVDTNDQLRRMYYTEAPPDHKQIRLGHAVAASAGVPGIFEPLSLVNLYPDRIIRLVDGGVCDNQGINSLLEQDCNVILTSDGSGQMESINVPSSGLLGVPLRANSILQARIRDAQYHDLERRRRSSLLRGLMFIHLKEGLTPSPIDWVNCLDPINRESKQILTKYGIAKDIQHKLAAIRTDLDSFSDIEAYSLMTSAYRMTEDAFKNGKCVEGFPDEGGKAEWEFLKIEEELKGHGKKYEYVTKLLETSNSVPFKVWRQLWFLRYFALFLLLTFIVLSAYLYFKLSTIVLVDAITVGSLGTWLAGVIIVALLTYSFGAIVKVVRWRETLMRIALGIFMCLFGWIAARIHLEVFDWLFLKRGSINSLEEKR